MALKSLGEGEASIQATNIAQTYNPPAVPDRLALSHDKICLLATAPTESGRNTFFNKWLAVPGDPSEPTSTVVLTSPRSYFVDMRVFKKRPDQDTFVASTDGASLAELQWAFAGQSSSHHDSEGKRYSTWEHWIDSQTDEPAEDKGEMIPLADGDVVEKGATWDEETGMVEEYEELWTEMALATPGLHEGNVCVVLRAEEDDGGTRGMMIRIGGWCQGVLKAGEKITLERWCWEEGTWKRVVRLGDGKLPCKDVVQQGKCEEGEEVRCEGLEWRVVEGNGASVFATSPSSHIRNSIKGMSAFFITLDILCHPDRYRPMVTGIKMTLDLTTAKSLPAYATNLLRKLDFAIGQL
ncbi:MAG: hypothetical protein Q9228_003730 [Teloschistes exilis]